MKSTIFKATISPTVQNKNKVIPQTFHATNFFFEKKINCVQIFTIKELNSLESRKKTFLSDLKIEKERKNPTDKQTEKNTKKKSFTICYEHKNMYAKYCFFDVPHRGR